MSPWSVLLGALFIVVHPLAAQSVTDQQDPSAILAAALAAGARGDSSAMAEGLARTLALDSTNVRAGRALMTYYVNSARYHEAYDLGEQIERQQPGNLLARFHYGWAAGYAFDTLRAGGIYRRLIAANPGGTYAAWSHGELAYLARSRGDFEAAVRHMEDGRREKADDPYLPVGHATMLLTTGKARLARAILDTVMARDSLAVGFGSVPAVLLRAWASRDIGDSLQSRADFEATERMLGARATRGDAGANWYLAAAAELRGRTEEALAKASAAVDAGRRPYGSRRSLELEGWWGDLREDERLKAIVAKAVARTDAKRRELGLPPDQ